MDLANKTAVITGSTSGIGLAIAQEFASRGANIMLNGFGPADQIEAERTSIESKFGVACVYSAAHMTGPAELRQMIADAETRFGAVDILVNNAGIQHVAPIDEFPEDKFDAIIAID